MDVFHDETRQRVPEMLKNNSRFHIQGVTQIEIRRFPYTQNCAICDHPHFVAR